MSSYGTLKGLPFFKDRNQLIQSKPGWAEANQSYKRVISYHGLQSAKRITSRMDAELDISAENETVNPANRKAS